MMHAAPCVYCERRGDELRIVAQQLQDAAARNAALQAALDRANAHIQQSRTAHKALEDMAETLSAAWDAGATEESAAQRGISPQRHHYTADTNDGPRHTMGRAAFRTTAAFPFRYVPPVDFLPEELVAQHAPLLAMVDKYAQLFHTHHVAPGVATNVHQTERDVAFLRSRVALLEVQLRDAERQLAAKAAAPPANDTPPQPAPRDKGRAALTDAYFDSTTSATATESEAAAADLAVTNPRVAAWRTRKLRQQHGGGDGADANDDALPAPRHRSPVRRRQQRHVTSPPRPMDAPPLQWPPQYDGGVGRGAVVGAAPPQGATEDARRVHYGVGSHDQQRPQQPQPSVQQQQQQLSGQQQQQHVPPGVRHAWKDIMTL